jgi:hypothetical protein
MTSGELGLNTERDTLGSDTTLESMCQELEAFREQEISKLSRLNPEECGPEVPSEARVEIDRPKRHSQ